MLIGRLNWPNAVTLGGVASALFACVLSYQGQLGAAFACLIATSMCDLFDGVLARKLGATEQDRALGSQLDTLADVIGYGVAPIIVLLHAGFGSPAHIGVMLLYVGCAVMRLAYFNVYGVKTVGNWQFYTGLPVAYIAIALPAVFILRGHVSDPTFSLVITVLIATIATLFVTRISVPKQRGMFYIAYPAIGSVLGGYWLFVA